MTDTYRPKHLAPPVHDLDASRQSECPACATDTLRWTTEHPHPPTYTQRWESDGRLHTYVDHDPPRLTGLGMLVQGAVRDSLRIEVRRRIGSRRDGSPIYAVPTPKPRPTVTITGLRITRLNPDGSQIIEAGRRQEVRWDVDPQSPYPPATYEAFDGSWPGDGPAAWRDRVEVDVTDLRALIDWVELVHSDHDPICEVAARLLEALGAATPEGGDK